MERLFDLFTGGYYAAGSRLATAAESRYRPPMIARRSQGGLLVVAAEPSADRAAARVLAEPAVPRGVPVFGIGGAACAAAGMELLADASSLSAVGPDDALRRIRAWTAAWCKVREALGVRRPRAALLVDAPDFNLPLARVLRGHGVAVVQYVAPQTWAWRPGRLGLLRERVDCAALVLPFEEPLHRRAGVPCAFVGHPLLDEPPPRTREEARALLGLDGGRAVVALLPGSRPGEVRRHAPALIDAASRLAARGATGVFLPAPRAAPSGCLDRAADAGCIVPGPGLEARDVLAAADAALVASGTATLEAALCRTPFAACYRLGPLGALAARALLSVPYVALPSWIAGRPVVPELLQERVTGPRLADAACALLEPAVADRQRSDFDLVRRLLGTPGAARRVARIVAGYLA